MALLVSYTFNTVAANTIEAVPADLVQQVSNSTTASYNNQLRIQNNNVASSSGLVASTTTYDPATDGLETMFDFTKSSIAANTNGLTFGMCNNSSTYTQSAGTNLASVLPASGLYVRVTIAGVPSAFYRASGGTATAATVANAFPTIVAGSMYRTRMQYNAGNIKVKMWLASGAEPAVWNVDMNLPTGTTLPAGSIFMASKLSSTPPGTVQYAYFDNVSVSTLGTTVVNVSSAVDPATASASMSDPVVTATAGPNVFVTRSTTATNGANSTGNAYLLNASYSPALQFDLSGLPANATSFSAVLKYDADTTGVNFAVKARTQAMNNPDTQTTANALTTMATGTTTASTNSTAINSVDVTTLVQQWLAGTRTNNGLLFYYTGSNVGGVTFSLIGYQTTSAYEAPRLEVSYYSAPAGATYPATPATASASASEPAVAAVRTSVTLATPATAQALSVGPAVIITNNISVVADTATAAASLPEPVVFASSPNRTVTAEAMTAAASMTTATFASPAQFFATAVVANATFVQPAVGTYSNAVISAGVAVASATIVPVAQEQGEGADPYFQRLVTQVDTNDFWLRLDEPSGTTAINRATNGATRNGTFFGGPVLNKFGLENRRVIELDGLDDYISLPDNNNGVRNGTMEIVFKTDQGTGSLMFGDDNAVPNQDTGIGTVTFNFITAVELIDGRVNVRLRGGNEFRGATNVADGRWHHVVVTWLRDRLQVFLDGALHFQRYLTDEQQIQAIPDTVGVGFKGQIMEFLYRDENVLSATDAIRNFYAAFGIVPVQAGIATAIADAGQNTKGKGNQKRALALYWNAENDSFATNDFDKYNWTGLDNWPDNRGAIQTDHYVMRAIDVGQYKVFTKSITRDENKSSTSYLGGGYFDQVTGELRYIDLTQDLDMSEYDLVFFFNTPPRTFRTATRDQAASVRLYEDLFDNLRAAQDEHGFSIWAPQPEVAIALGVIDRIEAHSMMRESLFGEPRQGNASGLYDARAAAIDPFEFGWYEGGPKENYYFDTHALNRFRVTAKVDGLTDLKGHHRINDMVFGRPRDIFASHFYAFDYEELANGYEIGMEDFYSNQDFFDVHHTSAGLQAKNLRKSVVSVPPANVKAGTVVLRETAKHWVGTKEVDNPWKNNAVLIAVEPGQSLKGRPVNGKIVFSAMSGFDDVLMDSNSLKQIVPPNSEILEPGSWENAEQRKWEYSFSRVSAISLNTGSGDIATRPAGENQSATAEAAKAAFIKAVSEILDNKARVIMLILEEKYKTEPVLRYTLIERIFNYLVTIEEQKPGAKVVRAGALTADATMSDPVIRAEKDVRINVAPAVALAEIVKPKEAKDPNVLIRTLALTASARMTGYGKTIQAVPATAVAEMVGNFDLVYASGEQVILYLHSTDARLYLKEDA